MSCLEIASYDFIKISDIKYKTWPNLLKLTINRLVDFWKIVSWYILKHKLQNGKEEDFSDLHTWKPSLSAFANQLFKIISFNKIVYNSYLALIS